MKELICINCPQGCHLSVDESRDYLVSGAGCEKGIAYGKMELQDPRRVLTSTVRIQGADLNRISVKTNVPIPKAMIFYVARALNQITTRSPVHIGDVIIANVCNTGADIVATRNL